ncbi:hypothetical protein KEM60_01380 [Austwickia sp. TVS 96-490-7B]|uniref:UTP--glucose-1-phosphate uridylyltransferase n=1 Tax=Austwickia sp. TVS 96-490-7B TaxID=2830843 RepID=UPI001C589F99|nr:UTP--glucose-1-phosphate uridylyltransferase [Austwickia sp. TVS 96-490-7B]MBW3085183.1 hypothetical protein [Austwickia sp. TVS 96-490-7B]
MSANGRHLAHHKMTDAGISQTSIDVFLHYYDELAAGATGLIAEADITPLPAPLRWDDIEIDDATARDALSQTVVIRLNGGLGTSMGMERAKSLVEVRDGQTFLDLICTQVRDVRTKYDVTLPLLFMDSFRTSADTLAAMTQHPDIAVPGLPLDFTQSREPKIHADDLTPVSWPDDPDLEWCPPGHGDLYASLLSSGVLDLLIEAGYRYATVANSDNLGATPDPRLAGWFATSGAPYAVEVARRTAADRKGGHLAVRRHDGRLVLRESAQTAEEDKATFADEKRHAFFNTNNLWLDLHQVRDTLQERHGILGLPLIRNVKTVDPTDPNSPQVYQIETAMGAAVEVFDGAVAVEVPRTRFLPVKTTDDLLLMRSDAYTLTDGGHLECVTEVAPLVDLDEQHYRRIADFEERFPCGAPSLRQATSLTIHGDWTFGADVVCVGEVSLDDDGEPHALADGTVLQ